MEKRNGFKAASKRRMQLSQETLDGLHITIKLNTGFLSSAYSFMELLPIIMDIPDVSSFFSVKLNQDLLEKHFGKLRQRGSANDNPTIAETIKSTQTIRVVDSIWVDDITGNCHGQKTKFESDPHAPLPKRKKK